jgi:hypothetical protein
VGATSGVTGLVLTQADKPINAKLDKIKRKVAKGFGNM